MEPIIDLAPGAEDNPLALEIAARIRQNLAADPRKHADFRGLRGSILVVAQDLAESLTLRFDHGRLTVHDGTVGIPAVTFCGDADVLRRLPDVALSGLLRFPIVSPLARRGRETWQHLFTLLAKADFKVYGLVAHPRTVLLLLRILSAAS